MANGATTTCTSEECLCDEKNRRRNDWGLQTIHLLEPKTNEYEGFDIEVIRSFAKTTGIDVEFVPTTWPTLSADLASGKFDMVVGV